MIVSRFNYKDRSRRGKRTWAVKAIITEEEKRNLIEGAAKLGDEIISGIVGRIDRYSPEDCGKEEVAGDVRYWFWIYEDEMRDIAFSMFFCLTALARETTPQAVKTQFLEEVED